MSRAPVPISPGSPVAADQDGDEWIVNGQKVWTSGGQAADLGMLIARTDWDVPKHQGISYFALDMHQPGVDVRPLREMTGRALFNEVFLTDARTPNDTLLGGLNNGWAVANTTLANERASLGAGGGHAAASAAIPGTVAGHLERRVGDFAPAGGGKRKGGGGGSAIGMMGGASKLLIELAKGNGTVQDPTIRQDLMRLHTMGEIGRYTNLRVKAAKEAGVEPPPAVGNIAKLSMSDMMRLQRDLSLRIVGAQGMCHAYDDSKRGELTDAVGNPFLPMITELALFAQAPPIYGGTDQVQRNIIGERVLGLPKEPNADRVTVFKDLPKNG